MQVELWLISIPLSPLKNIWLRTYVPRKIFEKSIYHGVNSEFLVHKKSQKNNRSEGLPVAIRRCFVILSHQLISDFIF